MKAAVPCQRKPLPEGRQVGRKATLIALAPIGQVALLALPRLRRSPYSCGYLDEALLRERMIREAVHELGHTYGLDYCHNAHCVMSFSNSLRDVDRKPHDFCPLCREKLA